MVQSISKEQADASQRQAELDAAKAQGGHHGHGGHEEESSDVDAAIAEGQKGGSGNGGEAPPESGGPDGGGGIASQQVKPELPDMDYANVDSLYFIGPFPNAGRANLYTKFPPESIIDLDAAYPGKSGQLVASFSLMISVKKS